MKNNAANTTRAAYVAERMAQMAPKTEIGREFAQMMAEWDWNLANGLIDANGRVVGGR